MTCLHIKTTKQILGKKGSGTKQSTVLTKRKCKTCGHEWIECKETAPPRNIAWTW